MQREACRPSDDYSKMRLVLCNVVIGLLQLFSRSSTNRKVHVNTDSLTYLYNKRMIKPTATQKVSRPGRKAVTPRDVLPPLWQRRPAAGAKSPFKTKEPSESSSLGGCFWMNALPPEHRSGAPSRRQIRLKVRKHIGIWGFVVVFIGLFALRGLFRELWVGSGRNLRGGCGT